MPDNVRAIQFDEQWLPVRVTYLRSGEVLDSYLIEDAGVLQIPPYGPDAVCVVEFADGKVAASKPHT